MNIEICPSMCTNKLFFKKRLYSLKMTETSRLSEHLNEFNMIVTQLLSLHVKMEDEDKELLFFSSLPPSYEHLVTTLIYGKDTLEIDEIIIALLLSEIMKINSKKTSR